MKNFVEKKTIQIENLMRVNECKINRMKQVFFTKQHKSTFGNKLHLMALIIVQRMELHSQADLHYIMIKLMDIRAHLNVRICLYAIYIGS